MKIVGPPGRGGVVPRGTAVPTGSLPSRGREYVGTPVDVPGMSAVRPPPAARPLPRSPLDPAAVAIPGPRAPAPLSLVRPLYGAVYPEPPVAPLARPLPPPDGELPPLGMKPPE